jgi:hypothetical protein
MRLNFSDTNHYRKLPLRTNGVNERNPYCASTR